MITIKWFDKELNELCITVYEEGLLISPPKSGEFFQIEVSI